MTHAIHLKHKQVKHKRQFPAFTFIGNNFHSSVSNSTRQLHFSPDSKTISQGSIGDSFVITQIHAAKNVHNQLNEHKIQPGATVKLVSKTNRGSVILSLGNKLIGISAEIADQIAAYFVS